MRHAISLLLATLLSFATVAAPPSTTPKNILFLVAHPDDENVIGAVLSRLAREGHAIRIVIATDGKDGTRVTKIPAGDELGRLRRKESECAAKALGLPRPMFLGIEKLDTRHGTRPFLEGRKRFLELLKAQLDTFDPDLILAFGPDGEYGHPEHIVASAAITELLLRDGLVERHPLYHVAWQREQVADDPSLSFVAPQYLHAEARFTDEDERRAIAAMRCYVTQYTKAEMDEFEATATADPANVVYLRRFVAPAREGTGFEKL